MEFVRQLWELRHFLDGLQMRMKFGELSRAPLELLRLELAGAAAQCDWAVRAPDPWDLDLAEVPRERRVSMQALHDALALRELLFDALPGVRTVRVRGFRRPSRKTALLVIRGTLSRDAKPRARSVTMKALLSGFEFRLQNGVLKGLDDVAVMVGPGSGASAATHGEPDVSRGDGPGATAAVGEGSQNSF